MSIIDIFPIINNLISDVCYLRLDFETFTTVGPTITTENGGTAAGTYSCPDQFKVTVSI